MELLKLLSANEIIAQVISFLILLFLLRKFAWKRILKILDERKEKIASEFKKIEDTQLEIGKLKNDYEAKLVGIEDAAKIRIQEAIEEGKKASEEIRRGANQDAQDIINSAKENIKHELFKAKEELKDRVIDLTIKATENVIQEKLTGEKDERLVRDFLDKVDEAR